MRPMEDDTNAGPYARHHTLGTSPNEAAYGNHNHNGINSVDLNIPVIPPIPVILTAVKTGLQAFFSTTPVDVFDMFLNLEANAYYEMWCNVIFDASSGSTLPNLQPSFTGPSGMIIRWSNIALGYNGNIANGVEIIGMTPESLFKRMAHLRGTIKMSTTPGPLQMRVQCGSAPSGALRVDSDSILCVRKIS